MMIGVFPFWSEIESVKLVKGKRIHHYYLKLLTSSNNIEWSWVETKP